jgi:hypothetical protein
MSAPARSPQWFIYYRIDPADLAQVTAQVQAFQRDLRTEWPGLATALLRRPGLQDASVTLMETYLPAPDADGTLSQAAQHTRLAQTIERAAQALAPWLRSPRRVEQFVPVA